MTADKKSSLVQIAQEVLDETNQAIKVNIVSGGGGGTIVGVATEEKQDDQIVELQAIKTALENLEVSLTGDIATAANQTNGLQKTQISNAGIAASVLNTQPTPTEPGLVVRSIPSAPLNVVDFGPASSALRVHLSNESLAALENINATITASNIEITNDLGNPIPVSGLVSAQQSGSWSLSGIIGYISLPDGASTSALQTTANSTLDDILTKSESIRADVSAINTKVATSANQSLQLTELQSIKSSVDGVEGQLTAIYYKADSLATGQLDGTQLTRITDGSNTAAVSTTAPAGSEPALVVRNIPSGIQNVAFFSSLPVGNNNIGDVDVASVPAPLNVTGSGSAVGTLRVHLADESLSALESITISSAVEITNDAGNPIPVSGSVQIIGTAQNDIASIKTNTTNLNYTIGEDGLATPVNKMVRVGGSDGTTDQTLLVTNLGAVVIADGGQSISIDDNGNSITVDGEVSATQSGTWNINNVTGTISLPTGAASESTLSALNLKIPVKGQALREDSLPVTIASDQPALAVSQSGTWNINNITGSITLPTGAASESTLSSINSKLPSSLGQKFSIASLSVVVASDQPAIPVTTTLTPITYINSYTLDYGASPVGGTPVIISASTTGSATEVEIFDSSGELLRLVINGFNSVYIIPGGNGRIPITIPNGSTLEIYSPGSTVNSGILVINCYG